MVEQQLTLTGHPLVDNGLATIAALCKCERIEDLTLRKVKGMYDGKQLARNNMKLRANYMVFINSITQQPAYSEADKIKKYSKATTDILNQIGHEDKSQYCDFCGAPYSTDIINVGRNWFPLSGSMNDAQGLPAGSRYLNTCAKCLFAVQYLPQSGILIGGLLTVFQSTSVNFWYQFVKNVTTITATAIKRTSDKIETLGKKEGSIEAVNRLLEVMKNSKRYDSNVSMIMFQYSNARDGDLKKKLIPNFTLNFLHEAAKKGLDKDIRELTAWETKKKLRFGFFNCITEQEDYRQLYSPDTPPELFKLYQTYILKYPVQTLYIACKIARYVKSNSNIEATNIFNKKVQVKRWVVNMVSEGLAIFDEYYSMFVRSPADRRNIWLLIKYYLLVDTEFKYNNEDKVEIYNQEFKDNVVRIGNLIYNRCIEEKGSVRMQKLLQKFANRKIGRNWLINRFQELHHDYNEDYTDNWKIICMNEDGQEDVYRFLELLRVLFTERIYKENT